MADFKRTRLHLIFRQEEEATRHHSKSISLQKSGHWRYHLQCFNHLICLLHPNNVRRRDAADELVECARILKGRLLNLPVQSACFYAKAGTGCDDIAIDKMIENSVIKHIFISTHSRIIPPSFIKIPEIIQ